MSNPINYVFVLDASKKPLTPCKPGMARSLLKAEKAKVFRRYPFTIILNKLVAEQPISVQLKIDPGSKQTGFALMTQKGEVIWAMVSQCGLGVSPSGATGKPVRSWGLPK